MSECQPSSAVLIYILVISFPKSVTASDSRKNIFLLDCLSLLYGLLLRALLGEYDSLKIHTVQRMNVPLAMDSF